LISFLTLLGVMTLNKILYEKSSKIEKKSKMFKMIILLFSTRMIKKNTVVHKKHMILKIHNIKFFLR
jgi:hypothetical protein